MVLAFEYLAFQEARFVERCVPVTGTVAVIEGRVFEYRYVVDGRELRTRKEMRSEQALRDTWGRYRVGDPIELLYLPESPGENSPSDHKPEDARLEMLVWAPVAPAFFGFLGSLRADGRPIQLIDSAS